MSLSWALACAIKALETIEATGPIERAQAWFLVQAYRCPLRAIVVVAPDWVAWEIQRAIQKTRDGERRFT